VNIKNIFPGAILILLIGYIIYLNLKHNNELDKYGRYTIGTTLGFTLSKDGREVEFIFETDGKLYKSSTRYIHDAKVPRGRYLVKFSHKDPSICEIYLSKPVAKSITPPTSGWKA